MTTTTTAPTREEIDELIEFCREEHEHREGAFLGNGVTLAERALSIAERLPALVEEREMFAEKSFKALAACGAEIDGLKTERDRLAAEVERLTNERSKPCNSAESSLSSARATIAELREVLAALVNNRSADWFSCPDSSDDLGLRIAHCSNDSGASFRVRNIRNARAALAKLDALPTETIDAPGPAHVELLKNPPVVLDDVWPDHVTFEAPKRGRYEVTIKPIDEALAATPLPEELATPKPFDEMTEEELLAGLEGLVPPSDASPAETYQSRVNDWVLACFGEEIGADKIERNHRFLEEALEAVQAGGCTRSEAHQLVDYVFDRPVGELWQEVGGVMNTLAAFCTAHGLDMNDCGERELARVWTKVEAIRAKQAAKPKHSPLPQYVPSDDLLAETERALAEAVEIMKPLYYFGIGATEIDIDTFTAASAFVEKHGGMK